MTRGQPVIGKDLKVPMSQAQRDAVAAWAREQGLLWGGRPNLAAAVRQLVDVALNVVGGPGNDPGTAVWRVPAADRDRVLAETADGDLLQGAFGGDEKLEVVARQLLWESDGDHPGPLHRFVITVAAPGRDTEVWAAATPAAAESFAIDRITELTTQLWNGDEDQPLWAETTIPAGHIPPEAWGHNEHA